MDNLIDDKCEPIISGTPLNNLTIAINLILVVYENKGKRSNNLMQMENGTPWIIW